MQVSVLQENLSYGLTIVSRAVSNRSVLPVLSNILLVAENGRLRLSATDLEIGVTCTVSAKILEAGATTVPARTLIDLVSTLSAGSIDLSLVDQTHTLEITTGASQARFQCLSAEDFPPLQAQYTSGLPLSGADLKEAILQVAFAAANSDARPILTGVLLAYDPERHQLTMVAVDGFRLAKRVLAVEPVQGIESFKIVLPARGLRELVRILRGDESVELQVSPNQVIFRLPEIEWLSLTLEGQFPDYEQIIPQEYQTRATLLTVDLLQACKQAEIFAREDSNITRLEIQPFGESGSTRLSITGRCDETGSNQTMVAAQVSGEPLLTAYNASFLQEALNVIKSPSVVLETQDATSPGVIRPADGQEDYIQIIMPMHTGDCE
jgi:DNA polymerase III subunit beta